MHPKTKLAAALMSRSSRTPGPDKPDTPALPATPTVQARGLTPSPPKRAKKEGEASAGNGTILAPSSFAAPCHGHLDAITASNNAFWGGFHDGQRLAPGRRAPSLSSTDLELLYLKGFVAGACDFRTQVLFAPNVMPDQLALSALGPVTRDAPTACLRLDALNEPGSEDPANYAPRRLGNVQLELFATVREGLNACPGDLQRFTVPDADLLLPPAILPVAGGKAPRTASQHHSYTGAYLVNRLSSIQPPAGLTREDAAAGWPPALKEDLFARGDRGCWLLLERHNSETIELGTFAASWSAFCGVIFPGAHTLSFRYDESFGTKLDTAFIEGSAEQIAVLTSTHTWSASTLSFFIVANRPDRSRFVCSFAESGVQRKDAPVVKSLLSRAMLSSDAFGAFVSARGYDPRAVVDSMDLEFLWAPFPCKRAIGCTNVRSVKNDFYWNVYMDRLSIVSPRDMWSWRELVASLRPSDGAGITMRSVPRLFWCDTCGSINHPEELCPTTHYDSWLGYLPALSPALVPM